MVVVALLLPICLYSFGLWALVSDHSVFFCGVNWFCQSRTWGALELGYHHQHQYQLLLNFLIAVCAFWEQVSISLPCFESFMHSLSLKSWIDFELLHGGPGHCCYFQTHIYIADRVNIGMCVWAVFCNFYVDGSQEFTWQARLVRFGIVGTELRIRV